MKTMNQKPINKKQQQNNNNKTQLLKNQPSSNNGVFECEPKTINEQKVRQCMQNRCEWLYFRVFWTIFFLIGWFQLFHIYFRRLNVALITFTNETTRSFKRFFFWYLIEKQIVACQNFDEDDDELSAKRNHKKPNRHAKFEKICWFHHSMDQKKQKFSDFIQFRQLIAIEIDLKWHVFK